MALRQVIRRTVYVLRHCLQPSSHFEAALLTQHVGFNEFPLLKCGSPRNFHTTVTRPDLMEFFDDKANWGEESVKTGRPWKMDELRIKSNTDLHKLWYVLLKERNMLLTMRHAYRHEGTAFPNPERIDKVEESMENLMEVIKERDNAYSLLETGEPAEREWVEARDMFGRPYIKPQREHAVPKEQRHSLRKRDPMLMKYQRLLHEKYLKERRRSLKREQRYIKRVKEQFPDASDEDIQYGLEKEFRRQKQGFYDVE
ncbi:large ribosomal subunit protein uL29m-like [Argopecten irradians]|uniref:large ribosomal subunit protein uL29m-like n=1 Tax=Argopecten irradians TaxID=31199 RepID=UPI00371E337A